MQQLQWNSMIPQHMGGSGAGSNAASAAADHHQQTIRGNSGNGSGQKVAPNSSSLAHKSAAQMSLQEILASSEYHARRFVSWVSSRPNLLARSSLVIHTQRATG